MANDIRQKAAFMGGMLDYALPSADTTVTDGVTNATTTVTSATAAFTNADIGAPISGGTIPAATYIVGITSGTSVVMSAAATGSASGVSITIGRSKVLQSAGLAAVPAVDSSHHMALVLDPDGVVGSPEVAYITFLTAGNTWAQISRGQEGTTTRAHNVDEVWVHSNTAYDTGQWQNVNVVTASGTAQTLPDPAVTPINDITLTGNCTFTFPSAPIQGKQITLVLRQDATGSRTVTWPGTVKWPGGTAPTLTTTASKADKFKLVCTDGTNWLGFTEGQNY